MSELSVALLQSFTSWHNPQANIISIQDQLNQLNSRADIIILPEMWLTGFTMKAHQFCRDLDLGLNAMIKWSTDFKSAIIGSLITKVDDAYYNRAYVISNGEIIHSYDKKHLFAFSGEDRFYNSGNKKCIFEFNNWKICLNVCYDLRFPVWSRNIDDYDILIYCANWPDKRISAWDTLLKARAIENQCYVLGVNCTGEDAWHNTYAGHSSIVNFDGDNLELLKGRSGILTYKLNLDELQEFRNKFPFLKDRDTFELQ